MRSPIDSCIQSLVIWDFIHAQPVNTKQSFGAEESSVVAPSTLVRSLTALHHIPPLFCANECKYMNDKWFTVESRFLEPSVITRTKSRFPSSVQHCNFTPDFSNSSIFRTNFCFPWRFVKSGFHCIFNIELKHRNREWTIPLFSYKCTYTSRRQTSERHTFPYELWICLSELLRRCLQSAVL